jgi:sugar/nucleoside kinase (ribokinase family)
MTLGDLGSVALDGDAFHAVPAFNVAVVDATGAGDVFRAGFIYGWLHGWPVARMLRFANAAAASGCTKAGAMPSVPVLAEVEAVLATSS